MSLKYYIIPDTLARELGLTVSRKGSPGDGWLVHIGDLAAYGVERAEQNGAREVSLSEARQFANRH